MKKSILHATVLSATLLLAGCLTDNKEAKRILEAEGYTEIRFTGYNCFACSQDDMYATGFVAKTMAGKQVKGTVCGGFLKGHTIRID